MAVIARGAGFSVRGMRVLALALFVVALVALTAARDRSDGSRLPAADAERAAMHDPRVQTALAGGFTRVRTMPLDERHGARELLRRPARGGGGSGPPGWPGAGA